MIYQNPSYVETFFNEWSEEMAYILGLFAADGSMYINKRGSKYIAFYSTDFELIYSVKYLMGTSNRIEVKVPKKPWKISYVLQIGGKTLYNRLIELGFTSNKSLKLQLPNIPDSFFCHFLRGYFDGDGGVYSKTLIRNNRPKPTHHLHLNIRCGTKAFLEKLHAKLTNLVNLKGGSIYYHDRAYSLAYYGKDVIELYSFLHPSKTVLCLTRKRVKLEEGIKLMGP